MSQLVVPASLPAGSLVAYAGATAPAGYLLCYGQNVSRTTYAALFDAIGTTWGAGDGSTTFTLPDLRGRAVFGKDNMGGSAASRVTSGTSGITGTTLGASGGDERLHSHSHSAPTYDAGGGGSWAAGTVDILRGTPSTNTSGAGSSQNMPPAAIVNWLIKV